MAEPIELDLAEYELDRHGVIEASAGTGKTYSISNLVVRLLAEREITLDQILVMTFTEKATGELLQAIRDRIVAALDSSETSPFPIDSVGRERLERALIDFDRAEITTIHGFCQRILSRHALMNREVMDLTVVRDAEVYDAALQRVLTILWPQVVGPALPTLLQLIDFARKREWFAAMIRRVAPALYENPAEPERSDRLEPAPEPRPDWAGLFAALETRRGEIAARLTQLDGPCQPEELERHPLLEAIADSGMNGNSFLKQNGKLARAILGWLLEAEGGLKEALAAVTELRGKGTKQSDIFKDQGFAVLFSQAQYTKTKSRQTEIVARYGFLEPLLAPLIEVERAVSLLLPWTIRAVRREALAAKRQQGLISFDDMLTRLAEALRVEAEANETGVWPLHQALWSSYQAVLVDEFQDTDRVQWEILERVFLRHPARAGLTPHPLTLIGDPKQAIYAFRGADLETYLEACAELERARAVRYRLNTSYRSTPALVAGLNALFTAPGGFAPGEGIALTPVMAAPEEQLPVRLLAERDAAERAPIVALALEGFKRAGEIQSAWAEAVAGEIARLLYGDGGTPLLTLLEKGKERPLRADDICILLANKNEATVFERALAARTPPIPCAFYKKEGVFQSEEALALRLLLRALADPTDRSALRKALLTPFFRWRLSELPLWETLAPQHPARRRLALWGELAARRSWSRLFASLLHQSGALIEPAPGALRRGEAHPEVNLERRRENLRHITEVLEREARRTQAGLPELLAALEALGAEPGSDEEGLHRLDSDRPKVQLLTMHKSKGLQFPVVFLAGLRQGRTETILRYHETTPGGRRIVHDLAGTGREAHERERRAEQWRLLYVALTRPRFRLYLSAAESGGGLATTLLAPLLAGVEGAWLARPTFAEMSAPTPLPSASPGLTAGVENPQNLPNIPDRIAEGEGQYAWLNQRARRVTSFTALSKHDAPGASAGDPGRLARLLERGAGESASAPLAPVGFDALLAGPGAEELPRGPHIGNILHDMMEHADYTAITSLASLADPSTVEGARLARLMVEYGLKEREPREAGRTYQAALAAILYATLHAPLPCGGTLIEIPPARRLHELEFNLPLPGEAGLLTGFIDLLLLQEGRYYILDWKSNWIESGYDPASLESCMLAHQYDLQYSCYVLAFAEWLAGSAQVGVREFEARFGGVLYFFMRGAATGGGIHFVRPTLAECRARVEPALRGTREGDA